MTSFPVVGRRIVDDNMEDGTLKVFAESSVMPSLSFGFVLVSWV